MIMAQYHLNNVPETLMTYIRVSAAKQGITIREYLIQLVERDLQRSASITVEAIQQQSTDSGRCVSDAAIQSEIDTVRKSRHGGTRNDNHNV